MRIFTYQMFKRILIPVDGSAGAQRGVEHGLELAEQFDAVVHTIFVVDERRFGHSPAISSDELFLEQVETSGQALMDELANKAQTRGLEVYTCCARGIPFEAILTYAEDNDIDLIVMGLHGRAQREEPKIGSTTERILREADVPVLPV